MPSCSYSTGLDLMIAGFALHGLSIWSTHGFIKIENEKTNKAWNYYVRRETQPLPSGCLLWSCSLCAWIGIMLHVSSHGEGPVSLDTRFLHIYDDEPVKPIMLPAAKEEEDERQWSIHSTAV